ncbi:MAG: hypothetical protein JWQ95_631 [Sphaerisporangium sp.]|nr:hypothetical protein [Sphaerisporangium sp.]
MNNIMRRVAIATATLAVGGGALVGAGGSASAATSGAGEVKGTTSTVHVVKKADNYKDRYASEGDRGKQGDRYKQGDSYKQHGDRYKQGHVYRYIDGRLYRLTHHGWVRVKGGSDYRHQH